MRAEAVCCWWLIMCGRARAVGGRLILKSARILPFEMRSETVMVCLLGIVLSKFFHYFHENRELAICNRIIPDLPVGCGPQMVVYGCLASHGCNTLASKSPCVFWLSKTPSKKTPKILSAPPSPPIPPPSPYNAITIRVYTCSVRAG